MAIERLETRRVLAAFIVDTLSDSAGGICGVDGIGNSGCSLRSAIIAANALPGPDTITLSPGTYTLSIDNGASVSDEARGDLNITENLTIIGSAGPTLTIIDGGQIDRIFSITGDVVTIRGVTLQNGQSSSGDGGAIVADGTLVIEDSIIRNHRTDGFGGAISFSGGTSDGILRIANTVLEGNASARDGGGIAAAGNVSLDNVTVDDNSSDTRGGGIAMIGGSRFVATNSTISRNRSTNDGGGFWAGNTGYDIAIVDSTIRDNVSSADGGGITVIGNLQSSEGLSSVLLSGVTMTNNQAALSGGGAYIYIIKEFDQIRGSYVDNSALGAGGALYLLDIGGVTVDGTSFTGNTSVDGGGAVTVLTDATFRNSLFENNRVVTTTVADQLRFDLGGGAIAIAQDFSEPPTIRVESSTIINNSAPLGGGIGSANANLVITNSSIEGNSTTASIGGGGGVGFAQDALDINQTQRAQLTITDSVISGNTSAAEAGGVGLADADAFITNSTVSSNESVTGRAGGVGMIGLNNDPVLTLNRVTIDNNVAASDGGGVAVIDAGFMMTNTTISNNSADGNGGGVAFSTSDNTVSPFVDFSTIASNRTGGFGGNVAAIGGVTSFRSSIIADPLGGVVIPARNFVSGGPGQLSSDGFNLVTDTSASFAETTDLINIDPLLGPLADNGGVIRTRALLANSPAIDAGADSSLPDARNRPRPVDGNGDGTATNDIGAFELFSQANDGLKINGVVFVDENNNGLDASDQRLPGVTVRLFRDGGDEVFGVDDTLVDSVVSETLSSGNLGGYFFTDLNAGLYFVVQDAASTPAGLIAPPPAPITLSADQFKIIQTIDNFSQTAQQFTVDANAPLAGDTVAAPEAIGGSRGLDLTYLFGPGTLDADVVAGSGLALSSSAGTGGRFLLAYNGSSSSSLGGVDLTGGQDDAGIVIRGSTDDSSGVVIIELFDENSQVLTATTPLPFDGDANVFVPFSDFARGFISDLPFDMTSIESIIVRGFMSSGKDPFLANIASAQRGVIVANLANQPNKIVPFVTAEPDSAAVEEDSSVTIDVLANDRTNVGVLRIVSVGGASNGTVTIVNGQVVYTPDPDYFGSDSFTYEVTNAPLGSTGLTSNATVSLDVASVNDPPVASDDRFATTQPASLILLFSDLLSNDTAGPANESQALSITSVTQPSDGSVLLTTTGVVFSPSPDFTGTTSFTYTVRDEEGATDTAAVTIDVLASGAEADLAILLSAPATAASGDTFDYTVTLRGDSSIDATGITARIILGQGVSFLSAGAPESNLRPSFASTVASNGDEVTLSLSEIVETEVITLVITVSVNSLVSPSAVVTTTATVSSQLPDPELGNNVDSFSTNIIPGVQPDLTGLVSCDANGNGLVDTGEAMQGVTVFIDRNGNRLLDAGEQSALTDDAGVYRFLGLDISAEASENLVVQNPPSCVPNSPEIGVTREALGTGRLSRAIAAVDMDRDGDLDLLVVNALGNDVSVLLNNQNSGTFTAGQAIPLAKRPQAISVWQPNPNVAPVVAIAAVGTVADKGALFVITNGVTTELSAGNGPVSVAVNDFNGDGRADFAVASLRSNNIVGRMSGEAGERVLATARSPRAVTTGFVNDDSFLDLIVVATGFAGDDSSEVIVMLGDGRGNFSPVKQTIPGRGSVDVAVGNFDDDANDEIVIANYSGSVTVNDFVAGRLVTIASVETEIGIEAVGARDINRDGRTDLVIANAKAETIELFLNTSDGFVRNKTITGVASPSDLVMANLDSDDIVDIAVANLYGRTRPNFSFPSSATVLGLTVAEREIVLTANQTTTADFQYDVPRGGASSDSEASRMDVDRNGTVTARDALLVINSLSRSFRAEGENVAEPAYVYDVNEDGVTTALDALHVINHISRQRRVSRVAEAEAALAPSELVQATDDDTTRRLAASRAANVDEALGSLGQLF